jgi:hypothetical protein
VVLRSRKGEARDSGGTPQERFAQARKQHDGVTERSRKGEARDSGGTPQERFAQAQRKYRSVDNPGRIGADTILAEDVMPNGGLLPSCFVCKWAKRDPSIVIDAEHNPLIEPVECLQHGFAVWLPAHHVCANLGDSYSGSGLATFAEGAGLEIGSIYAWLEVVYRTPEIPDIPQYHQTFVKLASLPEFSGWSLDEKQSAYARAATENRRELTRGSEDQQE